MKPALRWLSPSLSYTEVLILKIVGEVTGRRGDCAAKKEHFYGPPGHVFVTTVSFISDFLVTPANVDERLWCKDIVGKIKGMLIGDRGFLDAQLRKELSHHDIDLQTPLRDNMNNERPKHHVKMTMRVRKAVKTVLSVLCGHFALTKILAYDCWYFTSKLYRKIIFS